MTEKNIFYAGAADLLILHFLNQRESYAFELTRMINEYSEHDFPISGTSVILDIKKLLEAGKVSESKRITVNGRPRVYYRIEDEGRAYLSDLKRAYRRSIRGADRCLKTILQDIPDK